MSGESEGEKLERVERVERVGKAGRADRVDRAERAEEGVETVKRYRPTTVRRKSMRRTTQGWPLRSFHSNMMTREERQPSMP